jgi:hypothetical protein
MISGMKYHIRSEKIIGAGQFGKVYEGFEVETKKRGKVETIFTINCIN